MSEWLEVLYQDESLVVIQKPSGLLVHKSPIDKHETRYAMKILRDQLGCWVYPVHRLDKPTSGLLMFALSKSMAAVLADQFESRQVKKTYQALVRGYIDQKGVINYSLKEKPVFKHQKIAYQNKEAQSAVTAFKPAVNYELPFSDGRFATSRYTLVDLYPETGRRHQLRRHMKHISHPIIGDAKYGKGEHNRLFNREFDCSRLLLAATEIELAHPLSGDVLIIKAPLTSDFSKLLCDMEGYKVGSF